MPRFSYVEMPAGGFVPDEVFHLASKMLEGELPMPSLEVAQTITQPCTEEDLAKLRAKLATEAIATFEENVVHQMTPNPPFDVPLATRLAYLADVAAKCSHECQSLQSGLVQLVNDNNVLVVSRLDGNTIRATLLRVIMDSGAQRVMI